MSRLRAVAFVVLITGMAVSAGAARKDVGAQNTIERLCGEFSHVDSRKTTKTGGVLEHTTPLIGVTLKLYARNGQACCANLTSLTEEKSGADGRFDFKNMKPGSYWLAALHEGREYKLPFRLKSSSKSSSFCSLQKFEIDDSGDFRIMQTVGYL